MADFQADERSILHLYRRLIAARRASPALQIGAWRPLPSPTGTLAYERATEGDRRLVLMNFTAASVDLPLEGVWQIEIASDDQGEGSPFDGRLRGDCALILKQ